MANWTIFSTIPPLSFGKSGKRRFLPVDSYLEVHECSRAPPSPLVSHGCRHRFKIRGAPRCSYGDPLTPLSSNSWPGSAVGCGCAMVAGDALLSRPWSLSRPWTPWRAQTRCGAPSSRFSPPAHRLVSPCGCAHVGYPLPVVHPVVFLAIRSLRPLPELISSPLTCLRLLWTGGDRRHSERKDAIDRDLQGCEKGGLSQCPLTVHSTLY